MQELANVSALLNLHQHHTLIKLISTNHEKSF